MSKAIVPKPMTSAQRLGALLKTVDVRTRFEEMLGKRSSAFMSSVLSVANQNEMLKTAEPMSIIAAAAKAASLDLSIEPSLGLAAIVPYREKGIARAQFQVMAKGFVQLALRSGVYRTLNNDQIYDGMIRKKDIKRGLIDFEEDETLWNMEKVIAFFAYSETIHGFEKMLTMTVEQIEAHAKKYSKSFNNQYGPWSTHKTEMSLKTVMKLLLSKWGVLSTEYRGLEQAIKLDQSVSDVIDGEVQYPDNTDEAQEEAKEPPKKSERLEKLVTPPTTPEEIEASAMAAAEETK